MPAERLSFPALSNETTGSGSPSLKRMVTRSPSWSPRATICWISHRPMISRWKVCTVI